MQFLSNLFIKPYRFDHIRLKIGLESDFAAYAKLKERFSNNITKKSLVFFSPGCGSDFLTMFAIYDAIVSSSNKEITFVVMDFRDFFEGMVKQAKHLLPDAKLWYKMSVSPGMHVTELKFKDKLIKIIYYVKDFSAFYPPILKNNTDIYYERAFELFRSRDTMTMYKVYKNMKSGSLMISDFGFDFGSQKDDFVKLKKIPNTFGLYQKFQIWQKKYK